MIVLCVKCYVQVQPHREASVAVDSCLRNVLDDSSTNEIPFTGIGQISETEILNQER